MGILYHGSKERNIKVLEPRKSTHGVYVYATPNKALAIHFSKRCGDDLTYALGQFSDPNGVYELVELIPGAFEKMYSNPSSIYTLDDTTFKNIGTGFEGEVVSEVPVEVLNEEYLENLYPEILKLEQEGIIKIYRYPNKPNNLSDLNIIEVFKKYKSLNINIGKNEFDRLILMYPHLINEINKLIIEFGYTFEYQVKDIPDIFKQKIEKQLYDLNHEQYIDSMYIVITNTYPEISEEINILYEDYKNRLVIDNKKR